MSTLKRDEAGRIVIRLDQKTEADVQRIEANRAKGFNAMVRAGRLDPTKDFQYSDFTGISLAGADLRGFDFTGARLEGANLRKAKLDGTTILSKARLDAADRKALRLLLTPKPTAPPPDFDMEKVQEMILAGQSVPPDWVPWVTKLNLNREIDFKDASRLAGLINLQELYLGETGITDAAPLAGLVNLQMLDLDGTGTADASPLASLVNLQELYLVGTGITDAEPLAGLVNLQSLYLAGIDITDISPLADLVNLQTLDLSGTYITDTAPLGGLINLLYINLGLTSIKDVSPLATLPSLARIDVESWKRARVYLSQLGKGWRLEKYEESSWYKLRRDVPGVDVDD